MRERRQQRLETHPEMMRKRKAIVEPPWGTIKRGMDQGSFLRRGQKHVSTAMRVSRLAYHSKRVLNILGGQTMIEALACNSLFTSLRGHKNRTSSLPVNPRQLAFDCE